MRLPPASSSAVPLSPLHRLGSESHSAPALLTRLPGPWLSCSRCVFPASFILELGSLSLQQAHTTVGGLPALGWERPSVTLSHCAPPGVHGATLAVWVFSGYTYCCHCAAPSLSTPCQETNRQHQPSCPTCIPRPPPSPVQSISSIWCLLRKSEVGNRLWEGWGR